MSRRLEIGVWVFWLLVVAGPVGADVPAAAAQARVQRSEIPFTQDDRDRLIRMEEGQRFLQQQINDLKGQMTDLKTETQRQVNDLKGQMTDLKAETQRQIGDLRNLLYVILAGMFTLVGFVIWDRRTAVAPLAHQQRDIMVQTEQMERALKAYARVEPRLAEILRSIMPQKMG